MREISRKAGLGYLGQAKVGHDNVTLFREEQVLGLEVAVDDASVVQVLQRQQDLGGVEADALLGEAAVVLEVEEELATVHKVQHKVQLLVGLERVVQVDQEGMLQLGQDVPLRHRVLLLALGNDLCLLKDFHGIDFTGIFLPNLKNSPKTSLANELQIVKIVWCHFVIALDLSGIELPCSALD